MNVRLMLGVGALLVMSGCATQPGECDATNRDASLFTKVNCDAGGGYSEQIRQNEAALAKSQQENAMFHQVYQDIAAQQAASRNDLLAQQKSQAALNQSLSQLPTGFTTSGEQAIVKAVAIDIGETISQHPVDPALEDRGRPAPP